MKYSSLYYVICDISCIWLAGVVYTEFIMILNAATLDPQSIKYMVY